MIFGAYFIQLFDMFPIIMIEYLYIFNNLISFTSSCGASNFEILFCLQIIHEPTIIMISVEFPAEL